MTVHIAYLADHPADVPTVAGWLFDEWGYRRPGLTRQQVIDDISSKLSRDTPPVQLVALRDVEPVGIAILKPHEVRHLFPDYRFWLGSVFVPAQARGSGIATALCRRVEQAARDLAIPRLHLQTERLDGGLYARLGFQPLTKFRDVDEDILLMTKDLA